MRQLRQNFPSFSRTRRCKQDTQADWMQRNMVDKDFASEEESSSMQQVITSPSLNAPEAKHEKLLPHFELPCLNFPGAMWQVIWKGTAPRTVQCFCKTMAMMSWTTEEPLDFRLCDWIFQEQKAERMAKMEMMTEDERELWSHYNDLSEQECQWKNFMEILPEPKEDAPESVRKDFRQLVSAVEEKLAALDAELSDDVMQDRMMKLKRSFNHPEKKAILQRKISKILFDEKHAKEHLDRASDDLASATESLRQVLFEETLQAERKDSYTARDLYDIARRRYYGLKNEVQRLQRRIEAEEKKVISMDRARKMAQDVMTKGGFREYRKALRDDKQRRQDP